MPIALTAKIFCRPEAILASKWSHDMAHDFVRARFEAELRAGILKKKK